MERKKVFITPTTHWDREWVMTFGQFQVRLVNLIDNLMDIMDLNPEYIFLIDGQAIVFEDYLEIKPEQESRLTSYLKKGQLVSGPWYVLADQFLENGESTIRNLIAGISMIEKLGGKPMKLGYVPDSFGSTSSLPMILKGFDINYAAFGRGRPFWNEKLPKAEFWWEGPDGSIVLTASHGYGNGTFLSYLDIWTDIMQKSSFYPDPEVVMGCLINAVKNQLTVAATNNAYFSVGCDHMEPRAALPDLVKYINMHQDEYELVYGTPEDFLKEVEKNASDLITYSGEMRGSYENPMDLAGTLTSHMHLKQINDNCEILIQRLVEPLWSLTSFLTGANYPSGHLRKMWRLLLTNHPHDSICGCSIDQVHKDMMNRYEQIQSIGSYLIKEGMRRLVSEIDTRYHDNAAVALIIVNPSGNEYTGPVKGLVRIPKRFKYEGYTLIDSDNQIIPADIFHITDKQKDLESVYMTNEQLFVLLSKDAPINKEDDQVFTLLSVSFNTNSIPGFSYKVLWLKPGNTMCNLQPLVWLVSNGMENEYLLVNFNDDGTINIKDKSTGYVYEGLNYLVDREDIGNSYDYHGFAHPDEYDTRKYKYKVQWSVLEKSDIKVTFSTIIPMELPEKVEKDGRSTIMKKMPVTIYATLHAKVPRLDISIKVNNVCNDHCLRVAFESNIKTDNIFAYDHFNVLERRVHDPAKEWLDEPFQEFVDVSDSTHGLCIFSKGLPAYEAVKAEKGTIIYLTLLRSVGRLGPAAGADYPVPGAQCQRDYNFEFSIIPHQGDWLYGDCLEKAVNYRSQPLIEADLQHPGTLSPTGSCINVITDPQVKPFYTCFKQSEDRRGMVLRFWNAGKAGKIHVKCSSKPAKFEKTNLAEAAMHICNDADNDINVTSKSLTTLKITRE